MDASGNVSVIRETSLSAYFRQRLLDSARRMDATPQEETFWYLGSLLERFAQSDRVFSYEEERLDIRPLALLYKDALEVGDERQRCLILQHLGDMALFLGAVFPRYFTRRSISQDYLIGMGGASYDYLGANARHSRHIFAEIGESFAQFLVLMANAFSRKRRGAADVLDLYERWRVSRDPALEAQLTALGIDLSGDHHLH